VHHVEKNLAKNAAHMIILSRFMKRTLSSKAKGSVIVLDTQEVLLDLPHFVGPLRTEKRSGQLRIDFFHIFNIVL
jgi:hypothetical protein